MCLRASLGLIRHWLKGEVFELHNFPSSIQSKAQRLTKCLKAQRLPRCLVIRLPRCLKAQRLTRLLVIRLTRLLVIRKTWRRRLEFPPSGYRSRPAFTLTALFCIAIWHWWRLTFLALQFHTDWENNNSNNSVLIFLHRNSLGLNISIENTIPWLKIQYTHSPA